MEELLQLRNIFAEEEAKVEFLLALFRQNPLKLCALLRLAWASDLPPRFHNTQRRLILHRHGNTAWIPESLDDL